MRSVKLLAAAGAASLLSSMAFAADVAIAPPPMPYGQASGPYGQPSGSYYGQPSGPYGGQSGDYGGWYLRGDIGFSNQSVNNIRNSNAALYAVLTSLQETTGFDTAGIYQLGAGYQFNHWLRADITGEYRGNANFHGLDLVTFPNSGAAGFGSDIYNGSKSEWLFLANVYADLGTWWYITPYVGAGIGAARVTIAGFTDAGLNSLSGGGIGPGLVSTETGSRWNFAWALHAGLAYHVTPNMTIELGYSYVSLGDGTTGVDEKFDHSAGGHVYQFHNITSQDLKLGVRWNLDSAPVYAPPLITKG